ncbi:MAG: GNAT family N-acetyltransferase [Clostridium sp.]
MIINMCSILSKEEIDDIQSLENRCNVVEGLKNKAYLSNEINFNKELPCFYMAYDHGKIKAFLTTFMPTSEVAEIIAFTAPKERKNGYFKGLFLIAKEIMLKAGVKKVLFQLEPNGTAALKAIESFKPNELERSEYTMSCSEIVNNNISSDLEFKMLKFENKDLYIKLNNEIFEDVGDNENLVNAILNSDVRIAYIAYWNKEPVGIFNLAYEEEMAYCYGVGIIKKYRGKGFGKQLMAFALEEGLKHTKKIVLDVDSWNPAAYNLYLKCGFGVDFQVDYYLYDLESKLEIKYE